MGWGYQHTPFYIPDPRDPYDVAETAISHAAWGLGSWSIAYALTGSNPGPGYLGTLYRAFLSPAHVGASYAGTNAFDDTMFALQVYSQPLRVAARVAVPLSTLITVAEVGRSLQGSKEGSLQHHYESSRIARARDMTYAGSPGLR